MKKALFIFLLTLFILVSFCTNCFSQLAKNSKADSANTIIWSKDIKLNKTDFIGVIDTLTSNVAQTGANIVIVPVAFSKGKYQYRILAKFYKQKSWLKTDDDDVLNHEQLHFDIAELYARIMRKKIEETKRLNNVVLESDYRKIHRQVFQEYLDFQKEYDSQTENSQKKDIQSNWKVLIFEKLKELDKFSLTN